MLIQQFQKPPPKKKHKARNNPKPSCEDYCTECGKPYAELHEVFYGPYRQKSIRYKLQERLCDIHHRNGPDAVHNNVEFDRKLKVKHQAIFESMYSHERFMQEFDKNYLDCEVA